MNEQQVYSKGVSYHSTSHSRYTQDTLSMEYVPRNYSSSPLSSSPLPHTPFASSSPPGYPRVQRSPDIVGNKSVHGYPEDYDDISASWGTDHQRYIAPMKSLYSSSGMSVHTSRTSQRTFNYDASYASEGPSHLPRPVSPIETDEEEFPDIRQTCFAISSERGRWKSSPIPIKTHSRPSAWTSSSTSRSNINEKASKAKSNLTPLKLLGKSSDARAPHDHSSPTEWRRPSTSSSISDFPHSPVSSTLPSRSEEPSLYRAASSSLPPSSPPISPISIAPLIDVDDELEVDMLDSDDELPKIDKPTVHSQSESSKAGTWKEEESLIPTIATLDFSTLMSAQVETQVAEDESRQTSAGPLPIPSALGMPTPEATPAPQDTLPASPLHKPITSDSQMPMPSSAKEQSPVPEPIKQPLANKKNQPHPGQSTVPAEQALTMPLSTHIAAPMPVPIAMDVNVHMVSAQPEQPVVPESEVVDLVVPLAPTACVPDSGTPALAERIPSPEALDSPLTPLLGVEAFMDIDETCPDMSQSFSMQPSEVLPSRKISSTNNKAQRTAAETTTVSRSTQRAKPDKNAGPKVKAVVDETNVIAGSQIKARTTTKDKAGKAVANLKGSQKAEKIEERSVDRERKVIKQSQPSKAVVAGSSKPRDVSHRPVKVSVAPETAKHNADPVKRKAKAEECSEGPTKKKAKVSKQESVPVIDDLQTDKAHADTKPKSATTSRKVDKAEPSSSKSKPKKTKPTPSLQSSNDASPAASLDLTPTQLDELQGMLIEAFAVSRASSQPASALYQSMSQSRPSLKTDHSDKEWLQIIEGVLEAQSQSGMFGKVESSFKDDSARALEAKWFYVPERDPDQERAGIIRSMMPRAGKRSETKKYKQYYYQPLDKISRWDPEDDL